MPRATFTAPATLPLLCSSGASRTSSTSVLPLAIISRACAGVIRGTAALAASIICLTLVAMASSCCCALAYVRRGQLVPGYRVRIAQVAAPQGSRSVGARQLADLHRSAGLEDRIADEQGFRLMQA